MFQICSLNLYFKKIERAKSTQKRWIEIIEIKAEINVIHTEKLQIWKKFLQISSNGKIQFINLL